MIDRERVGPGDGAPHAAATDWFAPGQRIFAASAPGRLDVMGGIADYSGSLVLQLPLDRRTQAEVQLQGQPRVDVVSVRAGQMHRASIELDELLDNSAGAVARLAIRHPPESKTHWAAYVFGVAYSCLIRLGSSAHGFRMRIASDVPEGKGVSSSAALEVASLAAIAAAHDVDMSGEAIALAAQWAENHVAGAPCGIMDQMTSACGKRDHLLRLRCQPAIVEGHVAIPNGYRFFGIDSGIRHAVTGADYGTVRTAAFMGYRIIADLSGFEVWRDGDRVSVEDDRWHGYLANISPAQFDAEFEARLPERMSGAEFIARYRGITDTVTTVDPSREYPVRAATAHPVRENARVEQFAVLLDALDGDEDCARRMGRLMAASHESYGACGLGSEGTDRLVQMVVDADPSLGLYGAKITGGGSGGTVAILGRADALSTVRDIAARYSADTGRQAEVFAGSGMGLVERGVMTI